MPVGVVEHARKGALQPDGDIFLIGAKFLPTSHPLVAGRQAGVRRDKAQSLLPFQPPLALDVPAGLKDRVIASNDVYRRLVRRMTGAQGQPDQPGVFRRVCLMFGDEADRLIDQVRGQMVAVSVSARRVDDRVVPDQFRRELIGLGVHKPVVTVKAPSQRPAIERTGWAGLGQ